MCSINRLRQRWRGRLVSTMLKAYSSISQNMIHRLNMQEFSKAMLLCRSMVDIFKPYSTWRSRSPTSTLAELFQSLFGETTESITFGLQLARKERRISRRTT